MTRLYFFSKSVLLLLPSFNGLGLKLPLLSSFSFFFRILGLHSSSILVLLQLIAVLARSRLDKDKHLTGDGNLNNTTTLNYSLIHHFLKHF